MRSQALLALVAFTVISPITCANAFPQDSAKQAFYSGEERANDESAVPAEHGDRHPAFLANRSVRVEGSVGNLFAAGETIRIPGVVRSNAFVAGRTLHLEGLVEGDLFFAGESVRIEGELRGDLYGFFNEVRVLEGGVVGGDVYVGGERVWIEGSVGGRVVGGAQRVEVLGSVGEDLFVACERLELYEGASIGGDVYYDSPNEPVVRDEGSVTGRIERVVYSEHREHVERGPQGTLLWDFMTVVVLFLSTLLIGVILLLALGPPALRPVALLAEKPALGLGLGFVTFVVAPVTGLFLCFLPPAGLLLLALFGVAVFLARIVTAVCVGTWLLGKLGASSEHPVFGLFIGLVIFYAITSVPYLGGLAWAAWVFSGLGGMALALHRARAG